jgi:carbamate kinase
LLRNEAGYESYKIPQMPIDVCVADSQGGIGYMIERQMKNILRENKIRKNVITIITEVLVEIDDPAFKEPTKPVGKFYLKEEADLLARANNWIFKEDPRKRGWRRIVASPQPLDIVNKKIIKDLVSRGNIVIAAGGGGVPVYTDQNKNLQGIEAVIDKDSASSLLATEIGAESFYLLTDVTKVYINFGRPNQSALDTLTVDDARSYYDEGQFAAGSMGPKIMAAIRFLSSGGRVSIITEASELNNPNCGTIITK